MNDRSITKLARRSILVLLPVLMGGCPEIQNEAVDAFETATLQVLDAAVIQLFDEFRDPNIR